MINRTVIISTRRKRVLALDPKSGRVRWRYDARVDAGWQSPEGWVSRGVAVWRDTTRSPPPVCRTRVFLGTLDARLIARDAGSGKPCLQFGINGTVDLTVHASLAKVRAERSSLAITRPPAVIGDAIVVGSAIRERLLPDAASGVVRSYDARTGRLIWSFDPIPRATGAPGWEEKRGLRWVTTRAERGGDDRRRATR